MIIIMYEFYKYPIEEQCQIIYSNFMTAKLGLTYAAFLPVAESQRSSKADSYLLGWWEADLSCFTIRVNY